MTQDSNLGPQVKCMRLTNQLGLYFIVPLLIPVLYNFYTSQIQNCWKKYVGRRIIRIMIQARKEKNVDLSKVVKKVTAARIDFVFFLKINHLLLFVLA